MSRGAGARAGPGEGPTAGLPACISFLFASQPALPRARGVGTAVGGCGCCSLPPIHPGSAEAGGPLETQGAGTTLCRGEERGRRGAGAEKQSIHKRAQFHVFIFGRKEIMANLSTHKARPWKRAHPTCPISRETLACLSHSNVQQKPTTTQAPNLHHWVGGGEGSESAEKLPGEGTGNRQHRLYSEIEQRRPLQPWPTSQHL